MDTVVYSVPVEVRPDAIPAWQVSGRGANASLGLAGWWQVLVSLPLLLVLMIGWLWRLLLWARFPWLISRFDLQVA